MEISKENHCLKCQKKLIKKGNYVLPKKYCSRECMHGDKIVYHNCLKCKVELTKENTYPSVKHYCKICQYAFSRIAKKKWNKNHPLENKAQTMLNTFRIDMTVEEKALTNRQDMETLLKARLGTLCVYCNTLLTLDNIGLDHKIPRTRKGPNNWGNIHLICRKCNGCKASLTDEEFKALLNFLKDWQDMKGIILARMVMGGSFMKRFKSK